MATMMTTCDNINSSDNSNESPTVKNFQATGPPSFKEIGLPDCDADLAPRLSLMGMPGEIRNNIYSFVTAPDLKMISNSAGTSNAYFPVLLVCRQIYQELHRKLYGNLVLSLRPPTTELGDLTLRRLANIEPTHLALIKTVALQSHFPRGLMNLPSGLQPTCLIAHLHMPSMVMSPALRHHVNVLRGILYNLWIKLLLMEMQTLERVCLVDKSDDLDWVVHVRKEFKRKPDRPRRWRLLGDEEDEDVDSVQSNQSEHGDSALATTGAALANAPPPNPATLENAQNTEVVEAGKDEDEEKKPIKRFTFILVKDEIPSSNPAIPKTTAQRQATIEFYSGWEELTDAF
jgi:hypothetical protein